MNRWAFLKDHVMYKSSLNALALFLEVGLIPSISLKRNSITQVNSDTVMNLALTYTPLDPSSFFFSSPFYFLWGGVDPSPIIGLSDGPCYICQPPISPKSFSLQRSFLPMKNCFN